MVRRVSSDEMRRAAVERHLAIIGEALTRLRRLDPSLAARIPAPGEAVALRTVLIHGAATIDNGAVWSIVAVPGEP